MAKRKSPAVGRVASNASRSAPVAKPKARPSQARPPAEKVATAAASDRPARSNVDKVMFPETGFTKGNVIDYYEAVAPFMLPFLQGRAATLKRYPDGVDGKFFFEKRCPKHRPDWVKTARVDRVSGTESIDYCRIDDARTLAWTANLAAIELHVPMACGDEPERPRAMVYDLDPGPPADLRLSVEVAKRLRSLLAASGLESFVKLSGSKGLHLLVPLNVPGVTFDQTKALARSVAETLERDDPAHVITSMTRADRAGKIFIDWSQNDRNKTTVCSYSLRARAKPLVSWPVEWEELDDKRLAMPTAPEVLKRLPSHKPSFAKVLTMKQKLPKGN